MASDKVRQQKRSVALIAAIVVAGDLLSYLPGFQLTGKRAPACWNFPFAAQPKKPNKQRDVENALKEELPIKSKEVRAQREERKQLETELAKQNDDKMRDDEQHRQEVEQMNAEIQKWKTLAELGGSREAKLLQMSRECRSAIIMSLVESVPSMKHADAREVANAIDLFEDFEHEDTLRVDVTDGVLRLHYDGWFLNYKTFASFPEEDQKSLKQTVEEQIKLQKTFFPIRRTVKEVCSKHLEGFTREDLKDLAQRLRDMADDAALDEIDRLEGAFVRRASCIFQELEKVNVDVEGVLLDSWKPMVLTRASATLCFLEKKRAELQGEGAEAPMDIWKMLLQMHHAMKDTAAKRLAELAASALPPQAALV